MRIGIDVRYLSHGLVGGIHTYLTHVLPALFVAAPEHTFVLYADTKRPFELAHLPRNVTLRVLPYRGPHSSIWHDWTMQRVMARDNLDIAHFPANYGFGPTNARTIITLHDAINVLPLADILRGHTKNPRTVTMMTYLHACSTLALRRADAVITVSAHAAQEIAHVSGYDPARIHVVHHAPAPDLEPGIHIPRATQAGICSNAHMYTGTTSSAAIPDSIAEFYALDAVQHGDNPFTTIASGVQDAVQRLGIAHPYVLADALKNPDVLIRAWARLPNVIRSRFQIVFFARRDPLPTVQRAVNAGYAQLLVRPTRPDLLALYRQAHVFVFPSWMEGFGIPVLEAMACGVPVIASNRGALPEVLNGAGLLIDAEDDAGLAAYLGTVLTNPVLATHLRDLGLARAADFSWQRAAQETLAAYGEQT